jgi:hypothetical protein
MRIRDSFYSVRPWKSLTIIYNSRISSEEEAGTSTLANNPYRYCQCGKIHIKNTFLDTAYCCNTVQQLKDVSLDFHRTGQSPTSVINVHSGSKAEKCSIWNSRLGRGLYRFYDVPIFA